MMKTGTCTSALPAAYDIRIAGVEDDRSSGPRSCIGFAPRSTLNLSVAALLFRGNHNEGIPL
jgi:hypothetical protein